MRIYLYVRQTVKVTIFIVLTLFTLKCGSHVRCAGMVWAGMSCAALRCDAILCVLPTKMYMNIHMYKMADDDDDYGMLMLLTPICFWDRFAGKRRRFWVQPVSAHRVLGKTVSCWVLLRACCCVRRGYHPHWLKLHETNFPFRVTSSSCWRLGDQFITYLPTSRQQYASLIAIWYKKRFHAY